LTWLLLWDGGALAPRAAAQKGGTAPAVQKDKDAAKDAAKDAPVKRRIAVYGEDEEEEGLGWGAIAGIVAGVLVLGGIVYLALQQSKKQKKNKGGPLDEHMIGGYRLKGLMMTGQTSQ